MFIKTATLTALFAAITSQVAAQNATAADVALVEANMQQAGLIPGLLSTDEVDLEGVLNVAFGGTQITPGQAIAAADTASLPTLTVQPVTGTDDFESTDAYTAMLVDADIVGTDNQNGQQYFHWVANGVTVGTDGSLNYGAATTAIDYVGPGPLEGTGPHRYVLLLVEQDSDFVAPTGLAFGPRSLRQYLDTDGLGEVRAANFFTVENGQATMSIPATTSVDPATVVVVATTATTTSGSVAQSGVTTSTGVSSSRTMTSGGSNTMGTASVTTGPATSASPPANAAMAVKATSVWTVGAALVGAAAGALLI